VTGARSWSKSRAIGTTQTLEFALKALSSFTRGARAVFRSQSPARAALRDAGVAESAARSRAIVVLAHEKRLESAFSALSKKRFW
jgi:hypothetical protein